MQIKMRDPILDLDDEPIMTPEAPAEPGGEPTKKKLLLGDVCTGALMYQEPGEKMEGKKKVERLGLALRIKAAMKDNNTLSGGEIDLESEEITEIKSQIAKCYAPLVSGRAWMMIEGK